MADTRTEAEVLVWGTPHTVLIEPEDLAAWYPDPADDYGNGVAPAPAP